MNTDTLLQQLREQKNLSRESMADLLSVSKKTYERIERGERPLSLQEADTLSQTLDIPVQMLLPGQTSYINHGNVSVGVGNFHGNTIHCDSAKIDTLLSEIQALHKKIDNLGNKE